MNRSSAMLAAAAGILLVTVVPSAHAYVLTGHWTGKWSCRGVAADDGKFTISNKTSTLDVTQVGGTFAAEIDANTPDNFFFNAFAVPDLKKPDEKGEVILLGCALGPTIPANDVAEFIRAQVKTKPNDVKGKGSFKGTSLFTDFFNGLPEVGTCKYSYKRIDTFDPGIAACP